MSTATSKVVPFGSVGASPSQGPSPLVLMGPFACVPPLEELEDLTDIPDRRVVFRGVDWASDQIESGKQIMRVIPLN